MASRRSETLTPALAAAPFGVTRSTSAKSPMSALNTRMPMALSAADLTTLSTSLEWVRDTVCHVLEVPVDALEATLSAGTGATSTGRRTCACTIDARRMHD
eukprot:6210241-Pleurochrysis_carterae.AAC.4